MQYRNVVHVLYLLFGGIVGVTVFSDGHFYFLSVSCRLPLTLCYVGKFVSMNLNMLLRIQQCVKTCLFCHML